MCLPIKLQKYIPDSAALDSLSMRYAFYNIAALTLPYEYAFWRTGLEIDT